MNVAVLIAARMGSQRFPGKALALLAGRPMLRWVCDRAAEAYPVTVLLPDTQANDHLAVAVTDWGYPVVRGPSEPGQDVLTLFAMGCDATNADIAVRVTGDCPMVDPALVEETVDCLAPGRIVYASTTVLRTFARGLDVEAMDAGLVAAAHRHATKVYDREHVTPWMQRYVKQRGLGMTVTQTPTTEHRWQWSVDTPEELAWLNRMARVYDASGTRLPPAGWLRAHLTAHPADVQWDAPKLVLLQ